MQQKVRDYLDFAVALVISILIPFSIIALITLILSISLSPISIDSLGFISNYLQMMGISFLGITFGALVILSLIARIFTKNFWFIAPIILCLGILAIEWLQISAMGPGNVDALIRKLVLQFVGLIVYCAFVVYFYWIIRVFIVNVVIFKKIAYIFVVILLFGAIISRMLIQIDNFETLNTMLKLLSYSVLGISVALFIVIAITFLFLIIKKKDNLIIPQDFGNYFMEVNAMKKLFEKVEAQKKK